MKVTFKILVFVFLLTGSYLYSQNNSYKTGISNILNAKNPDDIGVRSTIQIQEDKNDPLEFGFVDDKDILWSTTVWEIIDLDERVNFPMLYPIDTSVVGNERRPMLWWLRQEIEKFNIPVYDPGFTQGEFIEKVPDADIENIFKLKIDTPGGEERKEYAQDEIRDIITNQVDKFGFNPYEDGISEEQKSVLKADTLFWNYQKIFPYEISSRTWNDYTQLTDREFSYEQYLGFTSDDGPVRIMQPDGIADPLTQAEINEYASVLEEILEEKFFVENVDYIFKNLRYEDMKQWLIKGMWYFDKKYSELIYRPIGIAPVTKPLQKNDEEDFGSGGGAGDDIVQRSVPPEADGPDQDGDGLSDELENDIDYEGAFSDPEVADTDGDGISDGLENKNGFNPTDATDGEDAQNYIYATADDADDNQDDDVAKNQLKPIFWVFYPHAREILKKGQAFNNRNTSKYISFDDIITSRRFSSIIFKEENVYENREVKDYIKNNSFMRLLESERIKEKIRNFEHDMWSW
tara:strand:- start:73 stop:1626 length:1554 start_codon:yes stop_codon:yes gene_type:complete